MNLFFINIKKKKIINNVETKHRKPSHVVQFVRQLTLNIYFFLSVRMRVCLLTRNNNNTTTYNKTEILHICFSIQSICVWKMECMCVFIYNYKYIYILKKKHKFIYFSCSVSFFLHIYT